MSHLAILVIFLLVLTNIMWYQFFAAFHDATKQRYEIVHKVLTDEQKKRIRELVESEV